MKRAFTLIEVVLAMSVSAVVMFGCCALMFDMFSVAERLERGWSLKPHADGVERFLRSAVSESLLTHPSRIENALASYPSKTLAISVPPESETSGEYRLTFGVEGAHPLFVSPTGFSPEKICWLVFDGDGLSLVWRHANAEFENSAAGVYKTVLSPFVKKIGYIYDGDSGWEEEDEIDDTDSSKLPYFIRLHFERGGEKTERIVPLSGLLDPALAQ
ncbi:MAG: prepilin-type N-terminal cleavage/methylation domain-containing protein [Opitutales bacterium]|nr:prepilin-type N-terminal cleavage/methylation domain-containing protein [Opitutales bacterium]